MNCVIRVFSSSVLLCSCGRSNGRSKSLLVQLISVGGEVFLGFLGRTSCPSMGGYLTLLCEF